MLQILYNDGHIVAVVKPAGVLSEDKGEGSMPALLRAELGCAYIGCVHRLDRGVGGVMVYALDQPSCGKLSAMVASHQMVKEYLAVVHGCPESPKGEMRDLLFKDSARNKSFVVKRMRKGVREAVLHYQLLETIERENGTFSLVQIRLETGRSHQIRVQFSSRKMPLVGDRRYGSREDADGVKLWSYRITLPDGKVFCCEPPEGFSI